tara:strand:+ start:493 stop:672 length:180 start_codon:yes stop_codon:yes gene_type:complete
MCAGLRGNVHSAEHPSYLLDPIIPSQMLEKGMHLASARLFQDLHMSMGLRSYLWQVSDA